MAAHRETLRANARNLTWPLSFHRLDLQLGFITTGCPDGQLHAASRGGRFLIAENAGDGRTNFEGELSTALLASLAYALFQCKLVVHSAHVATFGERAADSFYVTDLFGDKVESKSRLTTIERRLMEAATNQAEEMLGAAEYV